MLNFLRILSMIVCIFFANFVTIAQEITTPTTPKEQPLDKPTEVKEAPTKQDPSTITNPPNNLVAGSTPTGQSPTNTQDGTFVNRFQDIPVNLYMGTPIIGLPIYTLSEAGGASVPIGLNYNASGMKGHDVASWVGMNWSANITPQISRIVRGIPDEGKWALDNNYNFLDRRGFYQWGLKADNDDENDSQPDWYFLNINGTSYKFTFDANKKAHFFPESDIDVQVSWIARSNGGGLTAVGGFYNWIVTMPDGTKYFFDGSNTESSFELEANEATNGTASYGSSYFGKYSLAESITSAWYCNKIETAFGHQTIFQYFLTAYSFFRIAEQEATTNDCTFSGIDKRINKVFVNSATVNKISNQTHVVEINKDAWTSYLDAYGEEHWYLNDAVYPRRQDLDSYAQYPENSSSAKALHKITVYAKDDATKTLEWKFNYDYNYGTDQFSTPPFGYNYSNVGYTHQRRFKLRSVEEPDGNKYTFKYYDDGFNLPSRFTQGIDHWGYLNGVLGAITMIGEDAFRPCANGQYGNRTATSGWSQYGTLTAISHSTGGSTLLEYENHRASNYTPIVGGSRIKKITYVDSISNLKTVKKYNYLQADGTSSGFLCLKPFYHFDNRLNYIGAIPQFWHSGLYQQMLSESGRPAVGYSRVKETILSKDETDSLGYTISEFLQPLTEINPVETITYNCVTTPIPYYPYSITICDTSRYLRPWKWYPYHENSVGILSQVSVFGKNNQLLSENINDYQEQSLQGVQNPYLFSYRTFRLVNKNYNFERSYYEFFNTFRLKSQTTKTYSQDGTNPVISTTNYDYKDDLPDYLTNYPLRHNQVVKTSTTDSYGSTIANWTKYAMDFAFGTSAITNSEAQGISALLSKGIKTAVIENITKVKQAINNTNEYITNATYQTFYATDSIDVKAGMPKSTFVLENIPRLSMTEASNNQSTNVFTRSSDYDLKSTIESYTTIGLPIQSSVRFGPKNKVAYHATYPTLPISQTTNLGLSSEQTTTTEYANILYGVSKQTGVNALSVNNEYYSDGKLKQQTDKDGNVLKHIQYVYRGQADDDPLLSTSTAYNRVITRVPRIATTSPLTLTHTDCAISVVYMDGTGRVIENVAYRASPNQNDLVSGVTDYDKFNRPIRKWLSVERNQSTGALVNTDTVKSIAQRFYNDLMPYSEVLEYENSPLSRVLKSYGAGKAWRDNSKYQQMDYQTATGIKRLFVNNTDDFMDIGTYDTYELSKMISTDENGSTVTEYKDKSGNVVQRDVQVDATNFLTTAYAYSADGKLKYIFPPKAYNAFGSSTSLNVESWAEFNENVYATHYDGRGRAYESHKPGIGWSRVVYNRLNQVVMSQDDDELAKNNTWNYAHTDGQGRDVRSGQMQLPNTFNRQYLQTLFNNFVDNQQFEERDTIQTTSFRKYTNRSFPSALRTYINDATWKNIHYFDDYKFRYTDNYSGTIANYGFQINPYNSTAYSVSNAKGLMTGGLYKIDNFGDFAFPLSVFYDDKNRSIQSIIYQDLYARNQSDTKYNFVGEVLQSQMIYRKSGDLDRIITKENTLDHIGRTKDFYYTLKEGTVDKVPRLKMFSLFYDNIGRLSAKLIEPKANAISSSQSGDWTLASTWANNTVPTLATPAVINAGHIVTIPANTTVQAGTLYDAGTLKFLTNSKLQLGTLAPVSGAALQTIGYSYNVRGQMIGQNLDASGNPQVSQDKLFSYKLDFDFNETISKQTWKAQNSPQNKSYTYSYDLANRLKNAQFSGVGTENYSVSQDYDVNGNIQHLQRYSKTGANTWGLVDNLTYSYLSNGNKLQKVDDGVGGNILANDFRDVAGNDYAFSVDGKLTKDNNKGITTIDYNSLDLVSKITFSDGKTVENFYTSSGEKRQRKVTKNGITSYTLYDGEMVYQFTGNVTSLNDYKVSEIQNPEGRWVAGKLEYGYTDHVGNLRLSYKDSLGTAFVTQSQSYDPWSNVNAGSEYQLVSNQKDRYLVSGKETDSESGNILLDWRDYDSVTGRMNSFDPENQFNNISGYSYCVNNPVSHVDPSGRIVPLLAVGIGALIGGGINLGVKAYQGRINSWSDGFAAFGIGAVAGAAGAFTGGSAFLAAGGGAAGAGGFLAGAVGGLAGSAVSSPIQGFGNAAYFNDPYSVGDFGRDLLIGGVLGGAINGGIAGFKGKNFWNGDIRASGYGTFSFNNTKGLLEEGWTKLSGGKWSKISSGDLTFSGTDFTGDWKAAWGKNLGDIYYKNLAEQAQARLNLYPRVLDPRTGRLIPLPSARPVVPNNLRVDWNKQLRGDYIREYMRRGYSEPAGGWAEYDIHHILPRQYGGTNDFGNLVPVLRSTHQNEFNNFWKFFGQ